MISINNIEDVRDEFRFLIKENLNTGFDPYLNQNFTYILNCSFLCDETFIVNNHQIKYDDQWYVDNYDCLITDEQISYCLNELQTNKYTRRAIIYLGSPETHGICTESIHIHLIKYGLRWSVNMRSNDVTVFQTDLKWNKKWRDWFCNKLSVEPDKIYWNVSNLHIYEKDYKYL